MRVHPWYRLAWLRAVALAALLAHPTAGLAQKPRPVVGINAHLPSAAEVRQLRELGVPLVRTTLYWKLFESDAKYRSEWDAYVERAGAAGFEILALVHLAPYRYTWRNHREAYRAYAAFVGQIARRYPSVRYFELWNEQDGDATDLFGSRAGLPMRQRGRLYGEMLKLAYPAIKAANPSALVITGGTADSNDFPRGIYEAGARRHFDVMGIHTYGDHILGEPFERGYNMKRVMREFGDDKPLWNTEFGVTAGTLAGSRGLPRTDPAAALDRFHLENWRDPIVWNERHRLYDAVFPFVFKGPNEGLFEHRIRPARLEPDDFGFGAFRRDGRTARPAYRWLKEYLARP